MLVAAVQLLLLICFSSSWHDCLIASWILHSSPRVSPRRALWRLNAKENDGMEGPKYLRWYSQASASSFPDGPPMTTTPMELQTRVTTFQRSVNTSGGSSLSTVHLYAQFHFADCPEYYNLVSSSSVDTVFYELLLDESLLQKEKENGKRRIRENAPLQSSLADQRVARQYGWLCQVDATDYQQPHWYHADWTRQELLRHLRSSASSSSSSSVPPEKEEDRRPLWQRAAHTERWSAAYEATTALWTGPPLVLPSPPKAGKAALRRRIFTHLFLPGEALALGLRALLWCTIPCPECSILLLDGSLLYWSGEAPTVTAQSRVSPVLLPLLHAARRGRWQQVRQLVFGQVAVAGHSATLSAGAAEEHLLILPRNHHALQQVGAELERRPQQTVALLYGCHHCPDLHRQLERAGFQETQSQWRTAWSVPSRRAPDTEHLETTTGGMIGYLVLLVLPLYFFVGGLDWIETIVGVVRALEECSGSADASATSAVLLYLLRHVFLYVGLSKLVLDGETIRI
jgi:hypothetical protein